MENLIVVVILVVILVPAVWKTVQRFQGKGSSCCGGPKEQRVKKKLKGKVEAKWTIPVDGMHCQNCQIRVEKKLNELDRVVAKVDLERKEAILSIYDGADLEGLEAAISDKIAEAGYIPGNLKKTVYEI